MLSFIASGVFALVTIAALPPLGATGVLLAYAWLLLGGDVLVPRLTLLVQAWIVLAVAVAKWVTVDTLASRMSPDWNAAAYVPVLNPLMLTGLALAGSIVGMYRLRRDAIQAHFAAANRDGSTIAPAVLVLTAVALLVGIGLSLEIDRIVMLATQSAWPIGQFRQMAWTMLWSVLAAAYLLVFVQLDPSARRRSAWRGGVWLAAGFLALKFIVIDTLFAQLGGSAAATPGAVLNFQVLTALVVAGELAFVYWLLRGGDDQDAHHDEITPVRVGFAALVVLLWAGTLEIGRLVSSGAFPGAGVWPAWQLKNFAWTAWWAAGVTGFIAIATRRDETLIRRIALLRSLAHLPILLALKYLILDTLVFRLATSGPAGAAVVANLQTFAGSIVFGALVLIRH